MIILSKPEPMYKLTVVCPVDDKNKVIELLHEIGVVDIVNYDEEKIPSEIEALRKLREEIASIISKAKNVQKTIEITELEIRSLEIDKVKSDVNYLFTKINALESEIDRLREMHDEISLFSDIISKLPLDLDPRELFYDGKRISSILVAGDPSTIKVLKEYDYAKPMGEYQLGEDKIAVLFYVDKQYFKDFVEKTRSLNTWTLSPNVAKFIESSKNMLELRDNIRLAIDELSRKIGEHEKELQTLVKDNLERLGKYLLFVDNLLARYQAIAALKDLKHITVLTGWIPYSHVDILKQALSKSNIPLYYELQEPGPEDNPPTLMRNKPVLRLFQLITHLYGTPGYREWDPTPLIAYSFSLFFGLMNADFGYALVGILATLLVLDKLVLDPRSQQYREFKGILVVSNIVAAILGLLTGAVFGDLLQRIMGLNIPVLIPALTNPLDFIKLSLIIGLIHINIGHVLATIKFAKEKRKGELITEIGLFIAQVFGIPYILTAILRVELPGLLSLIPVETLFYGSMIGVVIIIVGSFLTMRILGLLMWIFQITGILGDVLSYVRLAGVGLATYYMALIFNSIVSMMTSYFAQFNLLVAVALSAPLIFLTHLIVFVFGQLGAFIHSLRLCMLEFMMKFYDGSGREYNPLRVVNRIVISTMG